MNQISIYWGNFLILDSLDNKTLLECFVIVSSFRVAASHHCEQRKLLPHWYHRNVEDKFHLCHFLGGHLQSFQSSTQCVVIETIRYRNKYQWDHCTNRPCCLIGDSESYPRGLRFPHSQFLLNFLHFLGSWWGYFLLVENNSFCVQELSVCYKIYIGWWWELLISV